MDLKRKLLIRKNLLYGIFLITTGILLEITTFNTDALSKTKPAYKYKKTDCNY